MDLEQLEQFDIVHRNNEDAAAIYAEILYEFYGWSSDNEEFSSLVERFLNAHASVPGPFGPVLSAVPLVTFEINADLKEKKLSITGYAYQNGAVIFIKNKDSVGILLCVNEETVDKWMYPKDTVDMLPLKIFDTDD